MEVEMSKASAPETPAGVLTEQLMEHVTSIMTLCGIEGISATKYQCGFSSYLSVTIAPFADAPEKVAAQGAIVKDALAQIMSVMNVVRILVKPSETELNELREAWEMADRDAAASNGGSGQAFSDGDADSGEG